MATVERKDGEIYYECFGEGSTVVFAHGAGGNAASWWQQIPVLVAAGYQAIAFDHRTFGRSTAAPLDFRAFPDDLLAILDAENVERFSLVCQSMGGWSGTPTALRVPERVRALVLCGTPGGVMTPEVEKAAALVGPKMRGEGGRVSLGDSVFAAGFAEREPALALLYQQISAFNVNVNLDEANMNVAITPEMLKDYKVPTLVIAGAHDVLFPLDAMRSVAAAIPGAELEEFPESGHSTYFEEADKFNRVLLAFLKRHAT